MFQQNIAVTGVGGGVGQSVIKSLYDTGYNIIGLDGELLGTGLYAVNKAYKIPYATNENYIPALLDICRKENCKLLFPGLDAELMIFSKNRDRFKEIGTTIVVSSPEVIDISDDKMQTFTALKAVGVEVPETMNLDEWVSDRGALKSPVIIKQRKGGARSKNVFLCRNENDVKVFFERKDLEYTGFIVQEYIEGDEYTCGTINLDDTCKGVIVMRRILRDGDTYKCFVEKNKVIEDTVRTVVNGIKPFGACNVQLRVKNGIPYVFEINARCSGTTGARSICGFNEPQMIADYLLNKKEPAYKIKELSILRYWKELVVENDTIEKFRSANFIEMNNHPNL